MNPSKLEVTNISKRFGSMPVLENVNLTLNQGEIVSLLGVSGCGKTTLFNLIAGLLSPDRGEIRLAGQRITDMPGQVSYMLQKDLLLPYRTIEDNVALPLILKGMNKKQARHQAGQYFERFGLSQTNKKWPHQLSGGMKQRAALLRTYLFSKDVALLDEPFSALDKITKDQMHQWFLEVMADIQMTVLFVTHDIDEAIMLSDRIYLLAGKPATISQQIIIESPKPRPKDFVTSQEFIHYKKRLIEYLN